MPEVGRVVLLVLDSLDDVLVERGIEEGWMPNLARLLPSGSAVRIQDDQSTLPGALWANWITGTSFERHGRFAAQVLQPGTYRIEPTVPEIDATETFSR